MHHLNKIFKKYLFKIPNNNYSNIILLKVTFPKSKKSKKLVLNFLPKINPIYKYTLVLNLEETLIYLKRDISGKSKRKVIILILFSFGTSDYVNPLIDKKKEKYFEYRLYRQHVIYDRKD